MRPSEPMRRPSDTSKAPDAGSAVTHAAGTPDTDRTPGPERRSGEILRKRAEARVAAALRARPNEVTQADLQLLIHELSVHQAELEMQNEELNRSQEALELSRARFFDLYDQAPVGFLTCGLNGVIAEVNRTAATLLGYRQDVLRGRRLSDFVAFEDRAKLSEHYGRLLAKTKPQACEVRLIRHDKSTVWSQVHMTLAAS